MAQYHQGVPHNILRRPRRTRPGILDLDQRVIIRIGCYLLPSDALQLFATCRSLRNFNTQAYKKLIFDIDGAEEGIIRKTADDLVKLLDTLRHRPQYALAVEAIAIHDTGSLLSERFTARADQAIARILGLTPNVHVFQWCGSAEFHTHCPEQTITMLRRLPNLRDLRIQGFEPPANIDQAMRQLQLDRPDLRSLERVVIRCHGYPVYWFHAFLQSAPGPRQLDFIDGQDRHYDLRQYAQSWRQLDTLVLSSTPQAIRSYVELMGQGLQPQRVTWSNLTSFSLNSQVSVEVLWMLVTHLAGCQLRRFRIVVNAFNRFNIRGFGAVMVRKILDSLEYLEELILDQYNTQAFTPLPDSWAVWGTHLRGAHALRILTLPIFFALDVMNVQPEELQSELASFAEEVMDTHLRKPNFQELRFLNTVETTARFNCVTGNRGESEVGFRVLRFKQITDHEAEMEGERGQYIAKYLGRQTEAKEAEMMFWMPRLLVN